MRSAIWQGYGMTETSCVISMTSHGDAVGGHVGGPVVCCEIKLVDIPDMNYTNADKPRPRGEVRQCWTCVCSMLGCHAIDCCLFEANARNVLEGCMWCMHIRAHIKPDRW